MKKEMMNIEPKVSLEQIVTVVSRSLKSHLITETAITCVKHERKDEEVLRAKIRTILKRRGFEM